MSALTLRVQHFRALRRLEWTPSGVCVLSGANGAGKSSTLRALRFLRDALLRGPSEACRFAEAGSAFRNLASAPEDDVVFEVAWEGWRWRLGLPVESQGVHAYHAESLWQDGRLILDVPRLQAAYVLPADGSTRARSGAELNTLQIVRPDASLGRFIETIKAIRVYDDFDPFRAPLPAYELQDHVYLHPEGKNLVPVLNNWRRAPRKFDDQFAWVLRWMRLAFPGLIDDLEFTPEGRAMFYPPGAAHADASLPLNVAADGLITGLLQLTAVAGAKPGSLIAFDEMENQLHPHAIRTLIAAMRERAQERDLSILLTTHSPVVLNAFADEPERIFVVGPGDQQPNPARLDELRDPAWLSMFALGDLYERSLFGAPGGGATAASEDEG